MLAKLLTIAPAVIATALLGAPGASARENFEEPPPPGVEIPAPPFWLECAKAQTRGDGVYANKECLKVATPGTGKYEIREGIGHDKPFKGHAVPGTEPRIVVSDPLAEGGMTEITCRKDADTGSYGLPNYVKNVQIVMSKCALGSTPKSGPACSSTGAAPGEIKFRPLIGELGYTRVQASGEAWEFEVGVRLESEDDPGGMIGEFECGAELQGRVWNQVISEGSSGGEEYYFTKAQGWAFEPRWRYPSEQELGSVKFVPNVNRFGFADELRKIEAGESPTHVLEAELCGPYVEHLLLGTRCTPPLYAGVRWGLTTTGEPLALNTPDLYLCKSKEYCRPKPDLRRG